MPNPIPLIRLENIKKVFLTDGIETHALYRVSFEICHGDYVSISGPSGCGKSTLLSILGLLDSPTSGSYELRGESVANLDYAERAQVRNREIGTLIRADVCPICVICGLLFVLDSCVPFALKISVHSYPFVAQLDW